MAVSSCQSEQLQVIEVRRGQRRRFAECHEAEFRRCHTKRSIRPESKKGLKKAKTGKEEIIDTQDGIMSSAGIHLEVR